MEYVYVRVCVCTRARTRMCVVLGREQGAESHAWAKMYLDEG